MVVSSLHHLTSDPKNMSLQPNTQLGQSLFINQAINHISIAPISSAQPGSAARQPSRVFNSKIDEALPYHEQAIKRVWRVRSSLRDESTDTHFLKVATEMAERTERGRLFQREEAQD